MKCPLRFKELIEVEGVGRWRGADCLKKECAWWEKEGEGCAVMLLGLRLGTVCDQLTELLGKLPPASL